MMDGSKIIWSASASIEMWLTTSVSNSLAKGKGCYSQERLKASEKEGERRGQENGSTYDLFCLCKYLYLTVNMYSHHSNQPWHLGVPFRSQIACERYARHPRSIPRR